MAVDLDNITLPSFNTITQHLVAQLGAPLATPPAVQLVTMLALVITHDNLMVASTVDTHLLALECLCALLPQILQQLNALVPLPSTSSGPGSTSTQFALPSTGNPTVSNSFPSSHLPPLHSSGQSQESHDTSPSTTHFTLSPSSLIYPNHLPFGDSLPVPKPDSHFWISFCNIGGFPAITGHNDNI